MAASTKERRPQRFGWGGRREGAGRKPVIPGRVPHDARPLLASRFPVLLTVKVDESLPSLRSPDLFQLIETCLLEVKALAKAEGRWRIVHYSVQKSEIHLIVEAVDGRALARAAKGFLVRVARRINKRLGRRGKFFQDRYASTVLKTPRQTRTCLCYVLNNWRRDDAEPEEALDRGAIDPCSSAAFFDGWRDGPRQPAPEREAPVSRPRTWLLQEGWRRCGLLDPSEYCPRSELKASR